MFLRNHFQLIKDAIEESWRGKEGLVMASDTVHYDNSVQKIEAKIVYFGEKWNLFYYETDHNKSTDEESLKFFLDNLNTDIASIDIAHRFQSLGIIGASWPDNELTVKNSYMEFQVKNLKTFFSPETGAFDFNKFFEEKRKCQPAVIVKCATRGLFATTNEQAQEESETYPQTYTSSLVVKPKTGPGMTL